MRRVLADGGQSEAAFQAAVREFAERCGWTHIHCVWDSRRTPPGYPDLTLLRPRTGQMLVAELKSSKGKPTAEQLGWLEAFAACGAVAKLWRPADWNEIEAALR